MKKEILGMVAILGFLFSNTIGWAQQPDADGKHRGEHIQEIFKQLNLTDEQKKELEANKQQNRVQMKAVHQQMKVAMDAMQDELMKPQLDMDRIHELHAKIKSLQNQTEDQRLNSILAVRQILTTDQFTKFIGLMHRHKPDDDHPPEH